MSYDVLAKDYTEKMLAALDAYELQKQRYADVQAAYDKPDRDPLVAKQRAASDSRLTEASGLAQWYRNEAGMYAAVVTALSTWAEP